MSLNPYVKLQVIRGKTPEELAKKLRGIRGQLIKVHEFVFDGKDHIAYVTSQRGIKIKELDNGN